jgi:aminoglycoside phosphotransferase (APT) family kinase protein
MNELVGSGRAAEVFRHGPATVVRRYRDHRDCTHEIRAMEWLRTQGLPVPRVDVASDQGSIIMEYISGQSMFEQLSGAPQGFVSHARTLAKLQRQINAVAAPSWFPQRGGGGVVVHMDLHPMNVIYGPNGPVVIDWTNFGRGLASIDAATTAVLVGSFEVKQLHERVGRGLFSSAFSLFRGRSIVRAGLAEAAELRLKDPNVTVGERRVVAEMARKHHRTRPR